MSNRAIDNLGPHLLKRVPSAADDRDFPLGVFLTDDPLRSALKHVTNSHFVTPSVKVWATLVTNTIDVAPTPPIPPTPVNQDVIWADARGTLDQGQTGHCVGFSAAQWGNTLPVDDGFKDADGHALYYDAKVIDREPGAEDGSSVRSGCKALLNRKRIDAYAAVQNADQLHQFLRTKGAVMIGIDWYNDMFTPNGKGFVRPTGGVAGGHAIPIVGDLVFEDAYLLHNSWGDAWGDKGFCKIRCADLDPLIFGNDGEAWAAVELPVAA